MKKRILSLALLYLVSVEALFPAHAFAMEGEQEVTDIYAWDDGGSNSTSVQDQAAVRDSAPEVQYDQTAALDTQAENTFDTGATAAGAETSAAEDAAKLYRYPGEVSEQYSVTLHVDDDLAAGNSFTGYTRTGNGVYSAVYDVNDTALLPEIAAKPGYEFAGWLDEDTGRFHEGSVQSYGAKTYSAISNPYMVTVKYVKNAPSGSVIGGTVPSTRAYAYNPDNPPAPTDYCFAGTEKGSTHEFAGWYKTKDCSGYPVTKLFDGAPTTNTTLTLYARWEPRTYTVSTLQWGTGLPVKARYNGAAFSGNINCGKKFETSALVPEDKNGMVFAGWYALESSGKWTKVGSVSAKNRRDITLYAKYNAKYRIVLHDTATGETYTDGLTDLSAFGSTVLPKISAIGWGRDSKFVGWSRADDPELALYGNGKKVSFKDDPDGYADMLNAGSVLNLYTVYADPSAFSRKLVFVAYDGFTSVQTVSTDESLDLSDATPPERNGYRFKYWKDSVTGKKLSSIKTGDKRPVIRLEAVYKPLKLSVRYYNNLPASVSGKEKKVTVRYTYNGKFNLRKNSFKAKGYTFSYWAADPAGKHPIAWAGSTFIDDAAEAYFYDHTVNSDRRAELYAIWRPQEYTYSLDDRGDHMFRAITVNPDEITWPISPMQWGGHEFVGWGMYKTSKKGILARDSEGNPIPISDVALDTPPAGNVYLFGKWKTKAEKPADAVSVEEFNALPDDGIDDREAITNAIAAASQKYYEDGKVHTVYIPGGTYKITVRPNGRGIDLCGWDIDSSIENHEFHSDHVKIVFAEDAVLLADYSHVKSDVERFSLFTMEFVDDVTIEGGIFDGNRAQTSGKKNGGHCIDLSGATNITLNNCEIKNAWTDGIYMGASFSVFKLPGHDEFYSKQKLFMGNNITVTGCTIKNSRRNNISVINADNVTIRDCDIKDAHGESPMAGIDIEPNLTKATYSDELKCYLQGGDAKYIPCQNFTIENTRISAYEGKSGDSYNYFCFNVIYDPNRPNAITARNVLVKDCTFNGDCYIGNGEKVTITNTRITGKFGDFFNRTTRN